MTSVPRRRMQGDADDGKCRTRAASPQATPSTAPMLKSAAPSRSRFAC
jgi:hypothetical protein